MLPHCSSIALTWRHWLLLLIWALASDVVAQVATAQVAAGDSATTTAEVTLDQSTEGIANLIIGTPQFDKLKVSIPHVPEYYSMVQTVDGMIYVATGASLLVFDGERWLAKASLNGQIIRSLAVDGNRVYWGGYDAFGYAERDSQGQTQLIDLSKRIAVQPASFADIWTVGVHQDGVYFRALRRIFCYQPKTERLQSWYHEGRFGEVLDTPFGTWAQFRGEGFKRRVGDEWQLLAHTKALSKLAEAIWVDDAMLVSNELGYTRVTLQDSKRINNVAPQLKDQDFHRLIALDNDEIALVGNDGHINLASNNLSRLRRFDLEAGFISDLRRSIEGNLLVAGTNGLFQVQWPSPLSRIDAKAGQKSSFLGLDLLANPNSTSGQRDRQQLNVYSERGKYLLSANANGMSELNLSAIEGDTIYQQLKLDSKHDALAEANELSIVAGEATVQVWPDVYPRALLPSTLEPDSYWVLTEHGLAKLHQRGLAFELAPASAAENGMLIDTLVPVAPQQIWAGTARNGLLQYDLDANHHVKSFTAIHAQNTMGLTGVSWGETDEVQVQLDGTTLLLSTPSAVLKREGNTLLADQRFAGALAKRVDQQTLTLLHAPAQKRWYAYTSTQLFFCPEQALNPTASAASSNAAAKNNWREMKFFDLSDTGSLMRIMELDSNTLLVLTTARLFKYDLREPRAKRSEQLRFTTVWRLDRRGEKHLELAEPDQPLILAPSDLGVRFEFALSGFKNPGSILYRGQLLGYENEFSEFSASAGYTYTRLRPGSYRMRLEARDATGRVFKTKDYAVVFSAKWYQKLTNQLWLSGIFVALLTILVRAWVRWRTRRLQTLINEQTQALAQANKRLQQAANLDALTGLANRRQLDEYLNAVWKAGLAEQTPLALLVIDADRFKAYNDQFGHVAGDQLLQALAKTLQSCLHRKEDMVARYGGEEFVVILPNTSLDSALVVAERLRLAVDSAALGATVSIGVAAKVPKQNSSTRELTEAADKALYQAKTAGRNRVASDSNTQ